jgi:hypothetical protein
MLLPGTMMVGSVFPSSQLYEATRRFSVIVAVWLKDADSESKSFNSRDFNSVPKGGGGVSATFGAD